MRSIPQPIALPIPHRSRTLPWSALLMVLALTLRANAGWNEFVAAQFPDAVSLDPATIAHDQPYILNDGRVTVIRHSTVSPLRFPQGIFVVGNSKLVIEEVSGGLQMLTPFLVVEDGGAVLAGGPETTNRFQTKLELILTGTGNEASVDQGIDDPQIYSLFDLVNGQYQRSSRQPGQPDPDERESTIFGNKVLAVGPQGRLQLYGAKGSVVSWTRLAATIDVDQNQNRNFVFLDGRLEGDWSVGDRIVVTTSDFEPDHTEDASISAIDLVTDGTGLKTRLTVNDIRHGVTGARTGGTDVFTDGPGTSFQWSHFGTVDASSGADIRATVGLLTRNIVVRSYRTPDAPRGALATPPAPIVDGLGTHNYTPPGGAPITSGPSFSGQEKYPGKFGDLLSRTSNRRDIYGGHALFRQGSTVRLSGVEFAQLGQPGNFGRVGRYPIHFHLVKEAPGSSVDHCSINESFNRWISIHGTFGLGLTNNVGYKSFGHGFYIEDGVEQKNVLDGNCGILARPALVSEFDPNTAPDFAAHFNLPPPSPQFVRAPYWNPHNVYPLSYLDRENPSLFWISNKHNYIRNNVAAGAAMAGRGYWLVGLQAPTRNGPAWRMLDADAALKARFPYVSGQFAPVLEFYNNTVYSTWNGIGTAFDRKGILSYPSTNTTPQFNWDTTPRFAYDADQEQDSGYTVSNANAKSLGPNGASPNDSTPSVVDMMARTTAFRNRQYGAWLRPYWWWVANSKFLDNIFGATLVSGGNEEASPAGFWGLVNGTDFVGFSDNLYRNQSRAAVQNLGEPDRTDRNPTFLVNNPSDTTTKFNYPEPRWWQTRTVFSGGTMGDTQQERRGYQYYDGPGPILSGVSFDRFYPTIDASFPGDSKLPKPQYDWTQLQWADWFKTYADPTNRMARHDVFLNAALGWFGPGNQWKYSALTWSSNLFFHPDTIVRHLVHDPYTFRGDFGDGDRQTFILDTDGSLQGFVGSGCVNNWPAHRGIDWVHECRSAESCLASPYHYGNTDILLPYGSPLALLFGKIQFDFTAPGSGQSAVDDHRYFIKGVPIPTVDNAVQLYGTLNAAGVRYTLQFREGYAPGQRENPKAPPTEFAIRFTTLEPVPGRNTMSYAICFPEGTTADQFRLSCAGVHVSQGVDSLPVQTFSAAWQTARTSPVLVPVTALGTTNAATLASGQVMAQWDATKHQLILTVTQSAARSRKAYPLGLCAPNSSQQEFAGRTSVTNWTSMLPHMEELLTQDPDGRQPIPIETVFEMIAKSLNDSPDTGGICVSVQYSGNLQGAMPDLRQITPAGLDGVFYDDAARNLDLIASTVFPPCKLSASTPGGFGGFLSTHFLAAASSSVEMAGPDADPDGDGLSNLHEYWSGSNPLTSSENTASLLPGIQLVDGIRYLTVNFVRPAGVRDLNFTVEWSRDLVAWEADVAAHEISVEPRADETEGVTVRTSRNVDANPVKFVRVRASLNP